MTDPRLGHAHHLLNLGRYEQAEHALGAYLVSEPDDVVALSWMALALSEQERFEEARQHVGRAVQIEPRFAYAWFVMAHVEFDRGRLDEAENAVREAIRLDPESADAFALLGSIHTRRKQWTAALEAAEAGLRVDPEDDACTNVRAFALRGLGRAEEAAHALEGQLQRTPEDSRTHANRGWTLLQQGDRDGALRHFREALRLDPESEWARRGVIEALKARHWFYRPMLRYFLWMNRLSGRVQVAILVGGYVLYRAAFGLARQDLIAAPVMWGVVVAYLGFALTSWFASPIANALLSFHPVGRLALTPRERVEAWGISGLLALAAAFMVAGWYWSVVLLIAGIALAIFCLPLKLTLELEQPRARKGMWAFTALILVVGAGWVGTAMAYRSSVQETLPVMARAARERLQSPRAEDDPSDSVAGSGPRDAAEGIAIGLDDARAFPELRTRIEAMESARTLMANVGLAYGILGFWISQLVAARLAARAERR